MIVAFDLYGERSEHADLASLLVAMGATAFEDDPAEVSALAARGPIFVAIDPFASEINGVERMMVYGTAGELAAAHHASADDI